MSFLGRTASRLLPVILEGVSTKLPFASNSRTIAKCFSSLNASSSSVLNKYSRKNCLCSCGCNGLHTKGDQELVSFLEDEIKEEKKSLTPKVPGVLNEFTIKHDRSQLILSRKFHDEDITVSLDVNHSVDAADSEAQESADGQEAELKSRPSFEVDIKLGNRVMSFTCSFMPSEQPPTEGQGQDVVEDTFGINELTIYDGEWTDEVYCVSGDILDANLYDLLLNYLEERGITEEFAEQLSDICSDYEHSLYVGLLQKVQDFVKRK